MRYSQTHVLSTDGAEHATGYVNANKIITLAGKTHVFWSDHYAFARAKTYDHASKSWSDTFTLGTGGDNHCDPAVTADKNGVLSVAYGPHSLCRGAEPWDWPLGQFKCAVASEPNSLAGLDKPGSLGYLATYACLINANGVDNILYRGGEGPAGVYFQKRRKLGGWTHAREIFTLDLPPCYTKFNQSLICDNQGALYAAANYFYIINGKCGCQGIAAVRSTDGGETWTSLDGQAAHIPVACAEPFALPNPDPRYPLYLHGLAADAKGRVWFMTAAAEANHWPEDLSRRAGGLLYCWDGKEWKIIDVAQYLPSDKWFPVDSPITIDTRGRIHILMQASDRTRYKQGESLWSHPSSEIFHLMTEDEGKTFTCNQVSTADENTSNWLPGISQSGPNHPVDKPVLLYTSGNLETRGRKVCCVFVEG